MKTNSDLHSICGIYLITSPKGKKYVGCSKNIYYRWKCYQKLQCKKQPLLYRSFIKYGVENHKFEIICCCERFQLEELELFYIGFYNTFDTENGLNLQRGGYGGTISNESKRKISIAAKNRVVSKETRKKIGEKSKGNKYALGYKHTKEAREKISQANKGNQYLLGHTHTKKSKLKMRKSTLKKWIELKSDEKFMKDLSIKLSKSFKGKHHTLKTKNKISKANKGRKRSEKTKQNHSKKMKKIWEERRLNGFRFSKK